MPPDVSTNRQRSHWGWGWADREPTIGQQDRLASTIAALTGWSGFSPTAPPSADELVLRPARITPPSSIAAFASVDTADRARHSYGKAFRDVARAFASDFEHPIDVVVRPSNDDEIRHTYEWAESVGAAVIAFGGGSSVVGGVNPVMERPAIALDTERLSGVFEVDETSLSAHVGGGTYGPALNRRLGEQGLTFRHFPQSFEFSTVGGWIATRAGGHYATGRTHIDDFVESTTLITPAGEWTSRRLPGSGAGPSPDRLVIGSEGTLGVITSAWIRVQRRPVFRASASIRFPSLNSACDATRLIAQSDLLPSNCRLLDATEALVNGAGDGSGPILIVGFESADHPMSAWLSRAVTICNDNGGQVIEGSQRERDDRIELGARPEGAESQWRDAFLEAPYRRDVMVALGGIAETFETACTWSAFANLYDTITRGATEQLRKQGLNGIISMRFTHVYPDGPAPYFTVLATPPARADASPPQRAAQQVAAWDDIKAVVSEAIVSNGATITHHHAVGRDHEPFYRQQRPDLFARSFEAVQRVCDPARIMNPGVLLPAPGSIR